MQSLLSLPGSPGKTKDDSSHFTDKETEASEISSTEPKVMQLVNS